MDHDKPSVAHVSRAMAKLYRAINPRMIALIGPGARVDTLAGQPEPLPVYITACGVSWIRRAESLIVEHERNTVTLDDLALVFEATHEPVVDDDWEANKRLQRHVESQKIWCNTYERS